MLLSNTKSKKSYIAVIISLMMVMMMAIMGVSVNVKAGTATITDVPATFNVMKPLTETELPTGTEVFLSYRTNDLKGDLATTVAAIVTVTNEQNTSIDYHHGSFAHTIYVDVTFTNSLDTFDSCPKGALVSNDGQVWEYFCWQGGKQNMPIYAYITDVATGTLTVTMDDTKLHFNKDSTSQTIDQSDIKSIAYNYNYDGVEKSGTFNDYTIKPDNTTIGTNDPDITVTYDLANSEQVVTLPVDYAVYFNLNGGTAGSNFEASRQYQVASKVAKPGNPTKNGYTFSRWSVGNTQDAEAWNFDTDTVRGVMTLNAIYKQNQTVSANDINVPYGDTAKVSYILGVPNDEQQVTYSVVSGNDIIQIDNKGNITTSKAGSATVKIAVAENGKYMGAETTINVNVIKVPITVIANDKTLTYGDPELLLDYKVSEDTPLIGDDTVENSFTGNIFRTDADNVNAGLYKIKRGTLSSSNYEIDFMEGTYEIKPKAITLIADDKEKVYGEDDPELTYTLSEETPMAYEETIKDLFGVLVREEGNDVGTYKIQQGTLSSYNYNVTVEEGVFTINKKPITLIAEDKTKVYGDEEPELTFVLDKNSKMAYEDTIEDIFSGKIAREPGKNVGTYTISKGTLHNKNYNITFKNGTFTITKKPVTLFAQDKTKVCGEKDPELTYLFSPKTPLCEGDVLGKDIEVILEREKGETPATYAIKAKQVKSLNYEITFKDGNFVITEAETTTETPTTEAPTTEVPKAKVDPQVVKTGDSVNPVIIILIMLVSAGIVAGAVIVNRKGQKK